MKTSTIVILGVVAVAGVGGFLYFQSQKKAAIVAAAAKQASSGGKSTGDQILQAINAGIPLATKIVDLWA
jgi:hypothetical protein